MGLISGNSYQEKLIDNYNTIKEVRQWLFLYLCLLKKPETTESDNFLKSHKKQKQENTNALI